MYCSGFLKLFWPYQAIQTDGLVRCIGPSWIL